MKIMNIHLSDGFLQEKNRNSMNKKNSFVNMDSVRTDEQRQTMEEILRGGFCPFCPENLDKSKLEPAIKDIELDYWSIRKNRWPYENTRIHLLIIHNEHIEKISKIKPQAWTELQKIIGWAEKRYELESGALGIRFGDPKRNGASVDHLHAHIITADVTDKNDPKYKPIRFKLG